MNFSDAIDNQEDRTQNGMKTRKSSASNCTDLFYKIGAMRKQNPVPTFVAALAENRDVALRVALWGRDIRGGSGERKVFRDILSYLESSDAAAAEALLYKIPVVGRFDDLFTFKTETLQKKAFELLATEIRKGNALAAKWAPREGSKYHNEYKAFRKYLGLSPKEYRGFLKFSNTVEQKMCAREWNEIEFGKVPSLAAIRYKNAFTKRAGEAYTNYLASLAKGEEKVNAGAVYPYDVIKPIRNGDRTSLELVVAQWAALPNYVGDASVLAMVDVSGSMGFEVGNKLSALDVALSLGLYTADKNKGPFKDCFLTFSEAPELLRLRGDIVQKIDQMEKSSWNMSTNLHAAFNKILQTALLNKVDQADMPSTVLILSDMQFNECVEFDDSAMEMIERKYAEAGYTTPRVVFWNLHDCGNVPVKADARNVALVSGFSPAVMTSVLGGDDLSPESVMLKTVMNERYNLNQGQ